MAACGRRYAAQVISESVLFRSLFCYSKSPLDIERVQYKSFPFSTDKHNTQCRLFNHVSLLLNTSLSCSHVFGSRYHRDTQTKPYPYSIFNQFLCCVASNQIQLNITVKSYKSCTEEKTDTDNCLKDSSRF